MKYGTYVKEHKIWFIIFGCVLFSIEVFLLLFPGSYWLMLYVALVLILGFFLGTYGDYRRWKLYFEKISRTMQEFEQTYLLREMLEDGQSQEEKLLQDIFYQMEVSMNDNVSKHRRGSMEYKEYVETWIHEIKTPIAAMKMILANYPESDKGISEELGRIEGYIEQALFYARSNAVEKDYLINPVNLQQLVQQMILKRKKALRAINAGIQLHDLDREVLSDSKWLEFILGQIVDNSIKYSPDSGLQLKIYSEKRAHAVLLHVKDNGCGMKEVEASRAFEKGFTGSNGRKQVNSTGIGLYLCKKLCQKLEHNITLSSREGEGTTVTLVFPISGMTY